MTNYTELKRGLQKLGFTVVKRNGERNIVLSNGETSIHIWGSFILHKGGVIEDAVAYYAKRNGVCVSWHAGQKNDVPDEIWTGVNYHIRKEELVNGTEDYKIARLMYMSSAQHDGHYNREI